MPLKKLKSDIKKVSHIVHVADCHIRLNTRHSEYQEVFEKLYEDIKKTPETTLVALLGDILHSKVDLSPECVQMASEFFTQIADIRPTILVAGNHDAVLANKNRLDSLSPIVDALNHPNLYYLRESGLYGFGNILLNNMSVFDPPEKYIKWKDIPTIYKQEYDKFIALFHGPVNNALTDIGYTVSSKSYPLSMFDGHDIALLGDIHMMQDLQLYNPDEGRPFVHFCGSLLQQNHGEDLMGHGYSLWDIENVKYNHIEIPNDYGHFTVDIEKGKLNTDISNIPKKARLRIRCFESIATEVKAVLSIIRKVSDISDIVYVRAMSSNDQNVSKTIGTILSGDLTDVEYQNKLIKEYLKKNLKILDKPSIENVLKVNAETNTKIKKDEFSRNIRWKPKKFEFDNMFSYGEGNIIDFSKLNDVVGIFAKNASGKSSILSSLAFCIFDKCDRAYKASYILNNQKMSFRCKFNFEINGVDYFIERSGKADKKGNVPVVVKFWKEENGEEIELHGEGRRDTNEVIRDYLGSYDDFILTTFSVQSAKNNNSFIDMGHSERKDLLSQFIGLTVFDRLYSLSYDRAKELGVLLKEYKNDDFTKKLVELNDALKNAQSSYNDSTNELIKVGGDRTILSDKIIQTSKKFVNTSLKVVDLQESEGIRDRIQTKIDKEKNTIKIQNNHAESLKRLIDDIQLEIDELVSKDTENAYKKFLTFEEEWKKAKQEVDKKKIEIRSKLDKLDKLSKHEYDPNCKYCVNNAFVKDALKTKEELPKEKEETNRLLSKLEECEKHKNDWGHSVLDYNLLVSYRKDISDKKEEYNKCNISVAKSEKILNQFNIELLEAIRNIEFYHNHQKDIESNKKIQKEIDLLNVELKNTEQIIKTINKRISDTGGKIAVFRSQIEEIKKKVDKAKSIEDDYEAYNLYIQCVGRDGIPYEVISYTVPEIEREVNNILHQIVEFSIELESDGKNIVPFIVYDKNKWTLELSSGFERFVSSLAIRVALINISNLPRPNFIAIDEGWGVMDPSNLSQVGLLFSYLKTNFDFVLIISHLDSIKDFVDSLIEITKVGGFSHIEHK